MKNRILLIEDNEMNQDMLSRRMERKGYTVYIASDGQEGIDMAIDLLPDLILMDMNLPVVNGWEATTKLKLMPETSAIPVIALTAHAMSNDKNKALKAGCDDYAIKPIDFPELLNKIEALLSNK